MRTGVFAAALLAVWVTRPIAAGAGSSSDGTAFVNGRETASAVSAKVEQAMGAQETLKNMELALPTDPKKRFRALGQIAKAAYDAGYYDKARGFSRELLSLAPNYRDDWYYGQAVATANIVLGRVALKCGGDIAMAESYLRASEATLTTPFLKIEGPNMSLAKDLLEAGDREPVLEFLEASRKSWTDNRHQLDTWERTIKAGGIPNFGPNLLY